MRGSAGALARILPPLWLGVVAAISLEAWLKFKAPGVTREIGLGIGAIVFRAINGVELALAASLAVAILIAVREWPARVLFACAAAILLVQTFWLLPLLVERAYLIRSGVEPGGSPVHLFYVGGEAVKMLLLLSLSIVLNRARSGEGLGR